MGFALRRRSGVQYWSTALELPSDGCFSSGAAGFPSHAADRMGNKPLSKIANVRRMGLVAQLNITSIACGQCGGSFNAPQGPRLNRTALLWCALHACIGNSRLHAACEPRRPPGRERAAGEVASRFRRRD
jgi:hypothetical protein